MGGLGIRGEVEDLVGGVNQQEVSKRPAGGRGESRKRVNKSKVCMKRTQ